MKKILLLSFLFLLTSTSLIAQKQGISIGGNVYFPVGNWAEEANTGFGGTASYEYQLSKEFAGVIFSGYSGFSSDIAGTDWTVVPLLIGGKFYFTPKWDWYIAGLLGVDFITANVSTTIAGQPVDGSSSTSDFAGNLNFGYELKTSSKGAVDFSAGYVFVSEFSYFGIRVAYLFRF